MSTGAPTGVSAAIDRAILERAAAAPGVPSLIVEVFE